MTAPQAKSEICGLSKLSRPMCGQTMERIASGP